MKFRSIEIEDTKEGSPYLLITYPTWSFDVIKSFHSIRCADSRTGFRKNYKFCNGTFKHARWGKNFDVYTLIPFHEELMLNRLLRQITGDPSFYCDVLDYEDFIIMRF
jgi:hypothetical protein